MSDWEQLAKYRAQHLILLVGTNPLPNWVAASLLFDPQAGGKIWLLHSDDDNTNTSQVAARLHDYLAQWLSREGVLEAWSRIEEVNLPSSDSAKIRNRLMDYRAKWNGARSIAFNYTGGTKPMAVHVYRWLEQESIDRNEHPALFPRAGLTCSYVDPRTLQLRFDGDKADSGYRFDLLNDDCLRKKTSITIDDLATLHGYTRNTKQNASWRTSEQNPHIYQLAWVIGKLYAQNDFRFERWKSWLNTEPTVPLEREMYPELEELVDAMDLLAGGAGQTPDQKGDAIAKALLQNPGKGFRSCHGWFAGYWLEEYAREALVKAAKASRLVRATDRDLNYTAKVEGGDSDNIQLDAAATVGYQLFAISCTTAGAWVFQPNSDAINMAKSLNRLEKKETAKEHLFEVYVRARQLGGDEAKVGLICFYKDPLHLENELRRSWDPEGKIKVFSRQDFLNLPYALQKWFEKMPV